METRVVALLKRIDRVRNPDTAHSRPARKVARPRASGADKKPSRSGAKRKREASAEEPDEDEQLHVVRPCAACGHGCLGV